MMNKHNFVTIADLTREKILYMIELAEEFERHPNRELLKGRVVATLFFEPSPRTRLSFETAANRLGARVIGFADPKVTSGTKGETLKDTILMVANYAYELAKAFNSFYQDTPILKEEDAQLKQFRVQLCAMVANALKNTMNILGIEVPERM
jgi:aspartate carbamoyltransferase catalytic subunit